jgi:hypothetical protein
MQWDTPENYERRCKRLKEQIESALRDIPEEGPFTGEQVEHLRYLVAERSELLHWDVYNDSFSRSASWLYNNYLHFHNNEARLAILAFRDDPSLRRSELGVAFEEYLNMIRQDRINDEYVAAWMKKLSSEPSG